MRVRPFAASRLLCPPASATPSRTLFFPLQIKSHPNQPLDPSPVANPPSFAVVPVASG
jgi:hypothetical protein